MATHHDIARALATQMSRPVSQRNASRASDIGRPRGAASTHPGVEFAVDDTRGEEHIFKTFDDALVFAGGMALRSGVGIELDVLVYSREGAVWWGGIDGGYDYDDDPEASVFDRLIVRITSQGRVP